MKMKDKFYFLLSKYIPKRLAYWAAIRIGVFATTGKYSSQIVPELTFLDAIKRYEN